MPTPENLTSSTHPANGCHCSCPCGERIAVGIVGGGIAGLYTALLLKRADPDISFHIFEGTERVGGRVLTHYFSHEKDQYFEAGAMRIPDSAAHRITTDLVAYLNEHNDRDRPKDDRHVELIKYVLKSQGNQTYVNGKIIDRGVSASGGESLSAKAIGWDVPAFYATSTAADLLKNAIQKLMDDFPLKRALDDGLEKFESVFRALAQKWDTFPFRAYLQHVANYPPSVIDFIETMESQTNEFALSVPEMIMQNLDFGEENWKTIANGMTCLPEAMLAMIGNEHVTFGARVNSVQPKTCRGVDFVEITATGYNGKIVAAFDKVVLAIPPAALKMIIARPIWTPAKEMAIRSMHIELLYKMGMRFKKRFWELVENPSRGGQTTTDLPIRWIVFPSYGIQSSANDGSKGPEGVLLIYAWMTDAATWLPLTPLERRSLALDALEKVYKGRLADLEDPPNPNLTVTDLLIETFDVVWSSSTATGAAMFLPGQWLDRFDAYRASENDGRIFFAGEHLSFHHAWISGAAYSALHTAREMYPGKNIQQLTSSERTGLRNDGRTVTQSRSPFTVQSLAKITPAGVPAIQFIPRDPLRLYSRIGKYDYNSGEGLPGSLGQDEHHALGPLVNHLRRY